MVEAWGTRIDIWPNICASKEQFDIDIHQNLVKIKKSVHILHKGHLIRKQLYINYSDSKKF